MASEMGAVGCSTIELILYLLDAAEVNLLQCIKDVQGGKPWKEPSAYNLQTQMVQTDSAIPLVRVFKFANRFMA